MLRLSCFLGRFLLGWASGLRTKIVQCRVLGFRGRVLTFSQTWFFETAHLLWPFVMLSFAFITERIFPLASFSAASSASLKRASASVRFLEWSAMVSSRDSRRVIFGRRASGGKRYGRAVRPTAVFRTEPYPTDFEGNADIK
jgi:hypothetical protein